MSRVYFHTPTTKAELRGSERAHMGVLVTDIAAGLLNAGGFRAREEFAPLIRPDHYLKSITERGWSSAFETAWRTGGAGIPMLTWRGHDLDPFTISLNTAATVGNDAVKLAARLHGQCEIHAWVDGPNRAWLADIIDRGMASGVLRAETQGWERVVGMLRARDDEPVVTSYSVCEQFPHSGVGGWMPDWPEGVPERWDALSPEQQAEREARDEEWYKLDDSEQWRIAMDALRADTASGLELKPENWDRFRFGNGLTVFDLTAPDRDRRLERAFGLVPELEGESA